MHKLKIQTCVVQQAGLKGVGLVKGLWHVDCVSRIANILGVTIALKQVGIGTAYTWMALDAKPKILATTCILMEISRAKWPVFTCYETTYHTWSGVWVF